MNIFVTLITGLVITITAGSGGTLDNPIPHYSDANGTKLASFDLPNNAGVVLFNPSASLHEDPNGTFAFKKIETTYNAVPYLGATMGAVNLNLIPDDPTHYRTSLANPWTSHVLIGGEMIVVYENTTNLRMPSPAKINAIKNLVYQSTNLGAIQNEPRIKHILEVLTDAGAASSVPQGQDWDMGWTMRNWSLTAGGASRNGWFKGVCPRGSGGLDNWHYNRLLYLALNFLNNPTPANWEFGLRQAIAHATLGREWTGTRKGMMKYEKGDAYLGEQQQPSWAKQWTGGLIVWALLSDDFLLNKAVEATVQMHYTVTPTLVWQGYWGARLAARYLEEVLLAYMLTKDPLLLAKAQIMITHVEGLIGPDGWWPNLGNGGNAEESPWMQAQLVTAIYRWYEQVPALESLTGFTKQEVTDVGAAIMQDGSEIKNGKRVLLYRMGTTVISAPAMHLSSFALPMLRHMRAFDNQYVPMYTDMHKLITNWAGSHFTDIAAGSPPALATIGYRFPPQGFGWSKAMLFYFEAMR
ncbi:MAG: hypothetical protein ACI97A_002003 [Planctomycetota bacterium]|jgi:hypothetical protein